MNYQLNVPMDSAVAPRSPLLSILSSHHYRLTNANLFLTIMSAHHTIPRFSPSRSLARSGVLNNHFPESGAGHSRKLPATFRPIEVPRPPRTERARRAISLSSLSLSHATTHLFLLPHFQDSLRGRAMFAAKGSSLSSGVLAPCPVCIHLCWRSERNDELTTKNEEHSAGSLELHPPPLLSLSLSPTP